MKAPRHPISAFTLVEMIVTTGVVTILGAVVFTFLNLGMTLYAQNASMNQTQAGSLNSTKKLLSIVASAVEPPTLVGDTGDPVTGSGPAAGIRFFSPSSRKAYPVPSAVSATATSFTITGTTSQPVPQAGDRIAMYDLGFLGVITSVSSAGSSHTVTFATSVGSGFSPVQTSGTVIPANSKCFLQTPVAFISVGSVLRHYPHALSVAQDGAATFNNAANYVQVAMLLPVGTLTNCFPFQYLDPGKRSVDVSLRIRAAAYGGRIGDFFTFQNLKTTVAYRPAMN